MLEEIVKGLENKINESLNSANLEDLFIELSSINESCLTLGVGGSKVVSLFLEKVLEKKNGIVTKDLDFDEYFLGDYSRYKNAVIISYSGKNHGVKATLGLDGIKKYLLTTRKSKIKNEVLLRYDNIHRTKSFISIEDTFIPLAIVLSYYLNISSLSSSFFIQESFNFVFKDHVNIVYDYESRTAAKFLETALVESGVANVTMHTKYSLCHGRSNLISSFENLVVYFETRESDIDKMFENNLPKITNNTVFLKCMEDDKIVGDFILTWKALCLLDYISREFDKEFVSVKYNKIVPVVYNFKGDF